MNPMMEQFMNEDPFMGEKIRLRPYELEDIPVIMAHINNYQSRVLLGIFIPWSADQEKDFIKKQSDDATAGTAYGYAMIEQEGGTLIGGVNLSLEDPINRSASLGIGVLDPSNCDKGFGRDALKCILKVGFGLLNFHRIELSVFAYNPRAIHVYGKVGFKEVGRKRDAVMVEGRYHDIIIMDILRDEFDDLHG
ncbi:MAG: GNAT family N-acetyltransferase [Promethearchaeota archaeon]